jgi:hypothetical protein
MTVKVLENLYDCAAPPDAKSGQYKKNRRGLHERQ